jgi:Galactose oxidase-like, Early set domain/Fibronectin type III domain/Kelch motif
VVGRHLLVLHRLLKFCSCSSDRSKVALVALGWFGVAQFIAVSSASAQDPATVGQFSSVKAWPYKAVHAHLLPTGKVLWWPVFANGDNPTLWNPSTNTNTAVTHAGANIFCSGHAFLPNGQLLVAGGHIGTWTGLPNAYTYDPLNETWTRLPDMNNGRWYPTSTTLPNGDVLVISGWINSSVGVNVEPQVWHGATASWRNLSTAHLALPFYPFMFVAPNGKVFCAGPSQTSRYLNVTGTGDWSSVANSNYGMRNWGSAVMYDDGKVLIIGGSPCGFYSSSCTIYPTDTAEIIDLNSPNPAWQYTASMVTGGRKFHTATLLPDGKVLVTGGSRGTEGPQGQPSDPAYACELWDPATGMWTTMASLTRYRVYHSIALLLPDGRVLSAGGQPGTPSAEIYSPPYLFQGSRPTITSAPASVAYGQSFFVGTPDAASISQVTLIALPSVTHGFNMGQRISRPLFSQDTGGLNVTVPSNPNTTPPGYYMLFILNSNGVPSVAKIIQIGGTTSTPTPPPTPTATATPRPSPTPTPTPTATPRASPTPTPTPTATPRASPTPTPTPTATPRATPTPTPTPPAAPSNLTATATACRQIMLVWTDNSHNETGFKIERHRKGNNWREIATVGANVTSYVSNLRRSGLRYFRVRAYNAVGNSDYSNTANADTTSLCLTPTPTPTATPTATPTPTPTPTLAAPTNLTATAVSSSQINLSWTDRSNNETGFEVYRSRRGRSFKRIATVGANVTTYADTGLTASTTYRYRVRAYNSGGNSAYSNIVSATTNH